MITRRHVPALVLALAGAISCASAAEARGSAPRHHPAPAARMHLHPVKAHGAWRPGHPHKPHAHRRRLPAFGGWLYADPVDEVAVPVPAPAPEPPAISVNYTFKTAAPPPCVLVVRKRVAGRPLMCR